MTSRTRSTFTCNRQNHETCIAEALAKAEALCQQHKKRFTSTRRRVLELVWSQHKPVGAYQLLEAFKENASAAPPTIYRALDFLQQMGLVHRIASLNAYVGCARPGKPHDGQFLICESCKALAELDVHEITDAIEQSAGTSGFETRRHTVEIMGLCPRCREERL